MSDATTTEAEAAPVDPRAEVLRQIGAFFPDTAGNKILIWTKTLDGDKRSHWCDTAEQAADVVMRDRDGRDVYIGMGLSPADFGPHARCKIPDIAGLAGLWLDGDVAGPTHSEEDGAAKSRDEVFAAAARFPLTPTLIEDSGTGLQLFWLFKEPWIFADDGDRRRAQVLLARFAWTMERYAKARVRESPRLQR
jgi:hypothetical protein